MLLKLGTGKLNWLMTNQHYICCEPDPDQRSVSLLWSEFLTVAVLCILTGEALHPNYFGLPTENVLAVKPSYVRTVLLFGPGAKNPAMSTCEGNGVASKQKGWWCVGG